MYLFVRVFDRTGLKMLASHTFKVTRVYYSVDAIKTLLLNQGIRPHVVDKAVVRLGWLRPEAHSTFVDPAAEKAISNPDLGVYMGSGKRDCVPPSHFKEISQVFCHFLIIPTIVARP